jgi:Putative 2OG-Fe(II) oxygenase
VRCYRLEPRATHAGIGEFNAAFARELRALHHAVRRPVAQTLRGGTQTEKHLPRDNPLVAEFFAMLDAPIRDYVSRLHHDTGHPVDRRRRAGYGLAGSWSVRLSSGGFHTDHVHPQGWLSSAYYVELPRDNPAAGQAGWLKFGQPGVRVGLGPDHFVKPEPGMLVLFPSYFWHGTVPLVEGGDRLTAAFDVVPN